MIHSCRPAGNVWAVAVSQTHLLALFLTVEPSVSLRGQYSTGPSSSTTRPISDPARTGSCCTKSVDSEAKQLGRQMGEAHHTGL